MLDSSPMALSTPFRSPLRGFAIALTNASGVVTGLNRAEAGPTLLASVMPLDDPLEASACRNLAVEESEASCCREELAIGTRCRNVEGANAVHVRIEAISTSERATMTIANGNKGK